MRYSYEKYFKGYSIRKRYLYTNFHRFLDLLEKWFDKLPDLLSLICYFLTFIALLSIPNIIVLMIAIDYGIQGLANVIVAVIPLKWYYLSRKAYELDSKKLLDEFKSYYFNEIEVYEKIITAIESENISSDYNIIVKKDNNKILDMSKRYVYKKIYKHQDTSYLYHEYR